MKRLLLALIDIYQRTLSPDHSAHGKQKYPFGYCRYVPSCSMYSAQAIEKHGSVKGMYYSLKRIMRCNPCSRGGNDPVP